jgi:hypothetical protein
MSVARQIEFQLMHIIGDLGDAHKHPTDRPVVN